MPARRLQYEKLQGDLQSAASQANRLAEENSALKSRPGGGSGEGLPPDPALADPLAAAQVAAQMEALLAEKSKLAAENDRLLRENTGLQVRQSAWLGWAKWAAALGSCPSEVPCALAVVLHCPPTYSRPILARRSCWSSRWCTRRSWRGTTSCSASRGWSTARRAASTRCQRRAAATPTAAAAVVQQLCRPLPDAAMLVLLFLLCEPARLL